MIVVTRHLSMRGLDIDIARRTTKGFSQFAFFLCVIQGPAPAFDLVTARAFGPPAVTAECAVGFLRAGGELVVTEPPEPAGPEAEGILRWDPDGLATLGFGESAAIRAGETGAMRIRLSRLAGEKWPRRDGVPAKRPLW